MHVLMIIADGIEELETVTVSDLLVRAGIKVTLASVDKIQVTAARGMTLTADILIADVKDDFSMLILPGGAKGAQRIAANPTAEAMVRLRHENRQWIAAICAAPALVLQAWQLLYGYKATCYPAFKDQLAEYQEQPVVIDRHIVTSQGPATAAEFSFAIIKLLVDGTAGGS